MHQIKFFKGVENELTLLEQQINQWLAESDVRVVQIFGNLAPQSMPADSASTGLSGSGFAPSDVFLAVVYDKA